MPKKSDQEPPLRLPIPGGIASSDTRFAHGRQMQLIRKLVMDKADAVSRRQGIGRREFLASACGVATTLSMINLVGGCGRTALDVAGDASAGGGFAGAGGVAGGGSEGGRGETFGVEGARRGPDSGRAGAGGFEVPPEAMVDEALATCALGRGGNELIIDMQTRFENPSTNPLWALALDPWLAHITHARYPWIVRSPGVLGSSKYDRQEYVAQILIGSDTTIGVLSGTPYAVGADGTGTSGYTMLTNEELLGGAEFLRAQFPGRILTHCAVMPNDRLDLQLELMERHAESYDQWKTYTAWIPEGGAGYWLDGPEGQAMLQQGLDLGAPIFCIHKGFPTSYTSYYASRFFDPAYADPRDIGPVARLFPQAHLVVLHSAFEHGLGADPNGMNIDAYREGPYPDDDPSDPTLASRYPRDRGVNGLISSLRDAGIGPNGKNLDGSSGPTTHVYAECGGVWPNLMLRPLEAQHYFGKVLKHIGEDRVVWGTDCIWFGSPQPLIDAFRAFRISQELQEKYGYPALTPARKEKILGRNAAQLQKVRGKHIMGCHDDYISV